MSGQIAFDWLTDEEEYLRGSAHADPTSPANLFSDGERKLVLILLRSLAALLILVAAAGSTALSPDQLERIKTEGELRAVLDMEEDAWRAKDRDRYDGLIDPQVDREWVGEWRDNWGASSDTGYIYTLGLGSIQRLRENLIEVEVNVALPRTAWWQPAVRRETRFYLNADGMWLRTLPPEDYWGEQLALETQHVTFNYFAADAESVRLAANRLDTAIADLYRILGQAPVSKDQRVEVMVKPGLVHSWDWTSGVLEVTSPTLAQVPREFADAEYLAERVFSRVVSRALREGTHSRTVYNWAFMVMVLRGWLGNELLEQPSVWRDEGDAVFRKYAADLYPLRLEDVEEFLAGGQTGRETVFWRYAAASSLLDYMVARSGQEVLPALLDGLSRYSSWSPLIEDLFDTTVEEFTAGWNEYLAVEYALGSEAEVE